MSIDFSKFSVVDANAYDVCSEVIDLLNEKKLDHETLICFSSNLLANIFINLKVPHEVCEVICRVMLDDLKERLSG